jgi:hypothetical protein
MTSSYVNRNNKVIESINWLKKPEKKRKVMGQLCEILHLILNCCRLAAVDFFSYVWPFIFFKILVQICKIICQVSIFFSDKTNHNKVYDKKGISVHVAPACVEPRKGSDYFGSYVCSLSCISARGCFQDLNPWPHGHKIYDIFFKKMNGWMIKA